MAITDKTRKLLWANSGGRCAICRILLFEAHASWDELSVTGDECHIIAREPGGPRSNPALSKRQLDQYANLILLCKTHHKIIDDQPNEYPVERLNEIRREHEDWVRNVLNRAKERQDKLGSEAHVDKTSLCDFKIIEKETGIVWSNLLNIQAQGEIVRFEGVFLAKTLEENANTVIGQELYQICDGRYIVYVCRIHRRDYCEASLAGVNTCGEYDPPLTLEQLQDHYPALAKQAGLVRKRTFIP